MITPKVGQRVTLRATADWPHQEVEILDTGEVEHGTLLVRVAREYAHDDGIREVALLDVEEVLR